MFLILFSQVLSGHFNFFKQDFGRGVGIVGFIGFDLATSS
jgi:hypothetical protein